MYQTEPPAAYWRDQLIQWGPRVVFAILILVATHFVAKAVQWAVAKRIDRMPVLKRHPQAGGESVGTELGRLAYWLVWLVGLIAALQPLGLSGVLTPVTALTNEVFAFLPRLLGAGLFFFAGLILARVVRHIIEAALGALNLERLLGRAGIRIGEARWRSTKPALPRKARLPLAAPSPSAVGVTVSAIIIIFAAIGALQILQVSAISDPATNMLNTIALAIPRVLAALVWLAIAFLIGRWVKAMLETVLPSLGFDNSVRALGVMPASSNPSKVVGAVAMTAILLAAAIEAARQLGGDAVAVLLFQITELGGKVIFGTVIIVVGIFLARILVHPGREQHRRGELRPDHRQICDHCPVHGDRPHLHGPCRPDRDDGVRPDPRLGRGRDGDRLRAGRARCRGAGPRSLDGRADARRLAARSRRA